MHSLVKQVVTVALLAGAGLSPLAVGPAAAQERIVSVGGAVTEIVHALGQEHRLVGRDTTSNHPPEILDLPDVGYMRALSPEGLLRLDPDLILASEGAGPAETVQIMAAADIAFIQVDDTPTADGVIARVEQVASALGVEERGAALASELRAEFDALAEEVGAQESPARVLFILSAQGGRINASGIGTAADGMLELAGLKNAVQEFTGYRLLTDEAVTAAAPDVILMMDRGGDHVLSDAAILSHPALGLTPAARHGRVIRMEGAYLLGFGPRTAAAARDLRNAAQALMQP